MDPYSAFLNYGLSLVPVYFETWGEKNALFQTDSHLLFYLWNSHGAGSKILYTEPVFRCEGYIGGWPGVCIGLLISGRTIKK
jgi:hypothetical protein